MDTSQHDGSARTTAKIADYMQIYGQRPRSSAKTKRSTASVKKSDDSKITFTATTGRRYSAANKPPRSSAMSTSVKEPTKEKVADIKKKVEPLEHFVAAAKSDRFELRRDIATYEHECSKKLELSAKLFKLNSLASSLPDIFQSFKEISAREQGIFNRIQEDVKELGLIVTASTSGGSIEIPAEEFDLKEIHRTKTVEYFRGVHQISGVHCLLVIIGDDNAERFHVKLQTMTGEEFGISVKHKLPAVEISPKVIRELLLPYFYLTITEGELKLNFDTRCSTDFATILTEIKGSPEYLNTLILTEEGEEEDVVYLTLLEPPAELKLPRSKLTSEESLFDESISKMQRLISTHLVYIRGSGELIWSSRRRVRNHTYSYKHQVSKLLDAAYVKEILEADFSILFVSELFLADKPYRIEVLGYRNSYKLKISGEDRMIELNSNSYEMKFLKDLQGLNLTSFSTLSKSLELEVIVAKLFPKRHAVN